VSYPNIPLGGRDWQRRATSAINYTLNQLTFFQFVIEDQPDAGESILLTQFPVAVPLVPSNCSGWAATAPTNDAVFTLNVGGASAGTITFPAGEQAAVVVLSTTTIPADTEFEIVAPTPQDVTLADITLTLAASL
jgi:hypothetical protein